MRERLAHSRAGYMSSDSLLRALHARQHARAAAEAAEAAGESPKRPSIAVPTRDPDRLRQGAVRLIGYANEVGEAFRPLVPSWVVNATYATAGTYVVADTAWRSTSLPLGSERGPLAEATDTLVWQTLASVLIPGFTINRVVWAASKVTAAGSRLPTVAGLGSIPFIVHPIDHGVDWLLDTFLRPLYSDSRPARS